MNTYTFAFGGQVEIEAETEAEAYEMADDLLGVSAWQGLGGVSVDDIRLIDTEEDKDEEEISEQPSEPTHNGYDDWTCVYDDLPKDNHMVLACDTEENIEKAFYLPDAEKWFDMNGDKWKDVIAWMELPKAYKGGK